MSARKSQPQKLRSARAYYRIARKFEKAGNYRQAEHYRSIADRRVAEHRREVERREAREVAAKTSPFRKSIS